MPVVVFAATVAGVLFTGGPALAGAVVIADGSHVLSRSDAGAVRDAASRLGAETVRIYTSTSLAGDDAAFDERYARKLATASPATIIIGVNTRSEHVTVHGGTGSHLHRRQSAAAVAAFTGGLRANHRYGDALVAMLTSLRMSFTGHRATTGGGGQPTTGNGNPAAPGGAQAATTHAREGLSTGEIAAITVGALVVVTIAVGICRAILGGRRRDEWA